MGFAEHGLGDMKTERGTPQWWLARMSAFESLRDEECGDAWEAAEERYRQRQNPGWTYKNRNFQVRTVRPPRVYAMVHAADAALLYNAPRFFATPTSDDYQSLASMCEPLVNGMWKRFVADEELTAVVRDTVKYGRGWAIIGYEDDYAKAAKARARRRKEARAAQADPTFHVLPPEDLGDVAPQAPKGEDNPVEPQTYERDARSLFQKPSLRRVSPWDVYFDPDAPVPEKMRWCARRVVAEIDAVKEWFKDVPGIEDLKPTLMLDGRRGAKDDSRYGQRQGILKRGLSKLNQAFASMLGGPRNATSDYHYVELFEIHVADNEGKWGRKIVANGFEGFLEEEPLLYDFGCPMISLAWNADHETLFTTSDVEQVMTQIIEEERLRTRLHDFMIRRADQPTLIDKRLLGNGNNLEILTNARIGSYAVVEGLTNNQPLQTAVAELPKRWELGETLAYLERLDREFSEATGLGPSQNLRAMKSDTSAAEAQNVNNASRARLSDKQKAVERFCIKSGYGLLGLAAQFFEAEQVATLFDKENVARWRTEDISAGDIQDGLHIFVEKGSMTPQSDERRAAFYQWVLQIWQDPVLGQKFDGDEAIKRWAEMFGVPDLDRLMLDGVDVDELRAQLMARELMGGGGAAQPAGAAEGAVA